MVIWCYQIFSYFCSFSFSSPSLFHLLHGLFMRLQQQGHIVCHTLNTKIISNRPAMASHSVQDWEAASGWRTKLESGKLGWKRKENGVQFWVPHISSVKGLVPIKSFLVDWHFVKELEGENLTQHQPTSCIQIPRPKKNQGSRICLQDSSSDLVFGDQQAMGMDFAANNNGQHQSCHMICLILVVV